MKLLVIHMGLPKAASKYFQHEIFAKLNDYEVLSDPKRYRRLRILTEKIFYRPYESNDLNIDLIDSFINEVSHLIRRSKKRKFIFSCEAVLNFYRFNGEQNIRNLSKITNFLSFKNFIQIKTFMVIRKQTDLIHSIYAYSHDIFRNEFSNISNFIEKPFENRHRKLFEYLDYNKLYNHLENNLGTKTQILLFEELTKNPVSFIKEIENIMEVNINIEKIRFEKINSISDGKAKNVYSSFYYDLLNIHKLLQKNFVYNRIMSKRFRNLLKFLFRLSPKDKVILDPNSTNKIRQIYDIKNKDFSISQSLHYKMERFGYF